MDRTAAGKTGNHIDSWDSSGKSPAQAKLERGTLKGGSED